MALTNKLTAIADAIRGKTGGVDKLTLDQMVTDIESIKTGGGFPNGTEWTLSNMTSNTFSDAVYGRDTWVTCDTEGRLYHSKDGKNWARCYNVNASCLCYANGCFVAAYTNGTYYSEDGTTWTKSNLTFSASSIELYDTDGLLFVTAGANNYYSFDGKTWNAFENNDITTIYGIHYANGLWVIGTNSGVYYSTNRLEWTRSNLTEDYFKHIIYAYGVWVAACGGASKSKGVYYSKDGKTWTSCIGNSSYEFSIAVGNGMFNTGDKYSLDGINWQDTNLTSLDNCVRAQYITYSDGVWVMSPYLNGGNIGALIYSYDGINWTKSNITVKSGGNFIIHANGIWIANGKSNGGIYYSVTWEPA